MRILEIIQLRSSGKSPEALGRELARSERAEGTQNTCYTIYRRQGVENDLAIHIHQGRVTEADVPGPSELGLRLASELSTHGLVEHTIWEELK